MENEIMNEEIMETEVDTCDVDETESGISTGLAMLIGAGLTAASVAAVKLGKKVFASIKAKKARKETDEEDFVDVTDEEIEK